MADPPHLATTSSPTPHGVVDSPPRLTVRPARMSVLLRSARTLAWSAVFFGAWRLGRESVAAYMEPIGLAWVNDILIVLVIAYAAGRIGYELLLRWSRLYTLDAERITSRSGVLRRVHAEAPLRRVQQITIDRTLGERLLGLGTILITTAGSQRIAVAWVMVRKPDRLAGAIRSAMNDALPLPVYLTDDPLAPTPPLVIGLVGGIGAGKSSVASILGSMNFLVVDADRDAKAALDLPEVRDQLVRWWGRRILAADGRVDRAVVAEIVFADPTQRARLEGVVHPIVKAGRASLIARASAEGRAGAVIDAPLLFEAGSEKECDVVMYVDAPEEVRRQRVRARGWSDGEFDRREKAQLPLEVKRRRADIIVSNASDVTSLESEVRRGLMKARDKVRAKKTACPA